MSTKKTMSTKKHTETCPKCGKVSSDRKFNFCPLCGSTVIGIDLESITSTYHPTRMPQKVEKILDEMKIPENERKTFLGSIGYSAQPDPSHHISGHAGQINNG